jgi:hypothetical protein
MRSRLPSDTRITLAANSGTSVPCGRRTRDLRTFTG